MVLAVAIGVLWLMVGIHAMFLAVRRRQRRPRRAPCARHASGRHPPVVTWQAIAMGVVTLGVGIPAGLILGRVAWTAIAAPANVLVRLDVAPLVVAGDGAGGDGAAGQRRDLAGPPRRRPRSDRRVRSE